MSNTYGIVVNGKKRRQRVDVFALGPKNTVLAFSRGLDKWLEFPGGGIDEGEDVLTAGLRELAEEAGWPGSYAHVIDVPLLVYPSVKGDWLDSLGFAEEEQHSICVGVEHFEPDSRYATEGDANQFTLMPVSRVLMELENTVMCSRRHRDVVSAIHRISILKRLFNLNVCKRPIWAQWE